MIVLKRIAKNLPGRERQPPLPQFATRMLRQALVDRLSKSYRRERHSIEQRLHGFVFRDHPSVRVSIFFGRLGEFSAGAVKIAPLRQITVVRKRHVKHWIRIDVLESIVPELQFIISQQRIAVNSVVRRRTHVMPESAQRQLRRFYSAAHNRPPFEHHTLIARLCKIRRSDQAVVPRSGNDDVVLLSHSRPVDLREKTTATKS